MNDWFNFKKPAYETDKMLKKAFCDDIMSRPHTPEGYSTFKDGHTYMEDSGCSSCPSLMWTNYNVAKVCKVIHNN
jgi:hypothetical protein